MAVKITKAPVQPSGISTEDAEDMVGLLDDLAAGEFLSTGESFGERNEANAAASKYIRYIESRYDVKLRSRTWEQDGSWTFGIRVKDSASPDEEAAEAPEPPPAQEKGAKQK